jgi:class 3 adenylate cyclase/tetratricopeptide (TPR) repeat protein
MRSAAEERKVVTVLFSDLVDSTDRADRRDPEDVRAMLVPFYRLLREELERFGGTVEKFIGDAVMALFGAPVAHEDDAERAVRAALGIRRAIERLNEERGVDLRVRTGVATGEALIALEARAGEGEGMAAGDVVNTGFRLAEAAPPGEVVVDERTYWATRDTVEYRARVQLRAKGKAEPLSLWQVERLRTAPERLRLPALVGRRAELEQLRIALARARAEAAPQLVTIVGVPGIGKSRLVGEVQMETEDEATWLQGRSLPYGEESSFWALAEIVKTHAGILRTDGPEETERKLRTALPAEDADWIESHLRGLVGLPGSASGGRAEAFAAWRRLLESLAAKQPLALVFDDIHWADEGLLEFVDYLVSWGNAPLLIVCTARPEFVERHPGWGRAYAGAATILLAPLDERETLELVAESLGRKALPEHVEAAVVGRVDGNPLYAQEYARMLVDRGLLGEEPAELPLPESVQAVIAARLDALPPEQKDLVQYAAVVGRACWVGALAALSRLPRYEVGGRLEALERKEFLRREPSSTVAGETQYSFNHVLVRDVAYAQMPRALRAERHQGSAEWLEVLTGSREDLAELIAHHYERAFEFADAAGLETGELRERSRLALRAAGDRALGLNAFPAAAHFYSRALELWPEDDPERPRLLFSCGKARFRAEGSVEELLAAREELVARGEHEPAAEADALLGEDLWMQGRRAEGFERFEAAAELLAEAAPSPAKASVLSALSRFSMADGRYEDAIRTGFEALQMAEALGLEELRAHALGSIGVARVALGDLGGIPDLERSVEIAVRIKSPENVRARLNLGSVHAHLGDLGHAFELYALARKSAEQFGDAAGTRWAATERMYELYWRGDWDEALTTAAKVIKVGERGSRHRDELDARLVRSWIHTARGELAEAVDDAESALEFARGPSDPQTLFPALALAARACVAAERVDEGVVRAEELLERWAASGYTTPSFWVSDLGFALAAVGRGAAVVSAAGEAPARTRWLDAAEAVAAGEFERAAELYAQIGSRPDEALAHLRAAQQLRVAGGRQRVQDHLAAARAFHSAVGAQLHLREAERLSADPARWQ